MICATSGTMALRKYKACFCTTSELGRKSEEATTYPNALIDSVAVLEEIIGSMYLNATDESYSREAQPGELSIGQRHALINKVLTMYL